MMIPTNGLEDEASSHMQHSSELALAMASSPFPAPPVSVVQWAVARSVLEQELLSETEPEPSSVVLSVLSLDLRFPRIVPAATGTDTVTSGKRFA